MEWNVLGHEWAAGLLSQHIARGEVRHAYLFSGPAGVGRRTLALRFAQAINCQNPPLPGEPCGICRSCKQLERMQQADLTVVQSAVEGTDLKVDAVRDLQRSLSLSPYESHYRIALLLRFQEATDSAQNALLKTLEEAPAKAILLLTADSAESLLPTIASRCENLRLRPLPVPTLTHALQTRWGLPPDEADLLAHISGGRVGLALRLHGAPKRLEQRRAWLEDLATLLGETRLARFAYAEAKTRAKDRETSKAALREAYSLWLTYWRDVLLCLGGADIPWTNPDFADSIRTTASAVDEAFACQQIRALETSLAHLNNANLQLQMENLLLNDLRL